jgi:nitrate reductase assembly molybdenum cofactor insertion protein NarJ
MSDQEQWLADRLEYAERQIELLTEARDTMGALWAREKETRHAAEAKLAKAVAVLQTFKSFDDLPLTAKRPDVFERRVRHQILVALAEIKGETK